MRIVHSGQCKEIRYALASEIDPAEISIAKILSIAEVFDIFNSAYTKDKDLFLTNEIAFGAYLITGTVVEVDKGFVRTRQDLDIKASEGWSERIVYPFDRFFRSFLREDRAFVERHPLIKGLFQGKVGGLYGFGYKYARNKFDLMFQGRANDQDKRYVVASIDMAPNDGNDEGVISIDFDDIPIGKKQLGLVRLK